MKKRYITLCNSEKYIKGTLVLYESLNATNTTIPLVVFCPNKTPKRVKDILNRYAALSEENPCKLEIKESEEDVVLPKKVTAQNKWSRWNGTFDKLLVFGLIQYEKLVFLDSDMLVLRNIDHLFDCPHLSACFDGQYDRNNLNSGLMVIEPTRDKKETARLMGFISEVMHNQGFGDQDVIRLAYPEWRTNRELHLLENYNLFFENAARMKREFGFDITSNSKIPIYVVHFIGYDKPWYSGKKLKWKIYNFCWKTRIITRGIRENRNHINERILYNYHRFLMAVNRKLRKLKVTINEMI